MPLVFFPSASGLLLAELLAPKTPTACGQRGGRRGQAWRKTRPEPVPQKYSGSLAGEGQTVRLRPHHWQKTSPAALPPHLLGWHPAYRAPQPAPQPGGERHRHRPLPPPPASPHVPLGRLRLPHTAARGRQRGWPTPASLPPPAGGATVGRMRGSCPAPRLLSPPPPGLLRGRGAAVGGGRSGWARQVRGGGAARPRWRERWTGGGWGSPVTPSYLPGAAFPGVCARSGGAGAAGEGCPLSGWGDRARGGFSRGGTRPLAVAAPAAGAGVGGSSLATEERGGQVAARAVPLWPSAAGRSRWPGRCRLRRGLRGCGGRSRRQRCAWSPKSKGQNWAKVVLGDYPGKAPAALAPGESRRRTKKPSHARSRRLGAAVGPSGFAGVGKGVRAGMTKMRRGELRGEAKPALKSSPPLTDPSAGGERGGSGPLGGFTNFVPLRGGWGGWRREGRSAVWDRGAALASGVSGCFKVFERYRG